jgi:hypothetical protein
MWMAPLAMGQSLCGEAPKDVPTLTQEQLKGDVEGKAELLTRLLGSAQLKGAVDARKMELHEQHKNLDQHQIDMYFVWVACQFIDKTVPANEKAQAWLQMRAAFSTPTNPSLPPRNPNALYQYGESVAEGQGGIVDQAHGVVRFQGIRTAGKADPTREFEYQDWIVRCPDLPAPRPDSFYGQFSGVVAGGTCTIVRRR